MSCELSLRIVPGDQKCLQYRQSSSVTCRSCPEFTAVAEIEDLVDEVVKPVEVIEMAKKTEPKRLRKGDKFTCPECKRDNATYESGGLCGVCNAKRRKERLAAKAAELPNGPVVIPPAEYPDLDADAAEVSAGFGQVTNADGDQASFGVDPFVHMALRDAWYEVERKALVSLSGLAPASAMVRASKLVQRIQTLEV